MCRMLLDVAPQTATAVDDRRRTPLHLATEAPLRVMLFETDTETKRTIQIWPAECILIIACAAV